MTPGNLRPCLEKKKKKNLQKKKKTLQNKETKKQQDLSKKPEGCWAAAKETEALAPFYCLTRGRRRCGRGGKRALPRGCRQPVNNA